MAANDNDKAAATATKLADATQIKIKWDDSSMKSVYANVCNVAGTREEVVLLFGMNQAWHSGQKELTIQLADRIVMSPFVAKRLGILLNKVIQNYESQYGPLKIEQAPRRPSAAARSGRNDPMVSVPGPDAPRPLPGERRRSTPAPCISR